MSWFFSKKKVEEKKDALLEELALMRKMVAEQEKKFAYLPAADEYLTQKAAAEFLGIGEPTFEKIRKKGAIPCARHGWAWKIKKTDLFEFKKSFVRSDWACKARGRSVAKKVEVVIPSINDTYINFDDYLTQREAEAFLDVTPHYFQVLRKEHRLARLIIGKKTFYRKTDIEKIIDHPYKRCNQTVVINGEEYISGIEAQKILGVSHSCLAKWLEKGLITDQKHIGCVSFFKKSELLSLDLVSMRRDAQIRNLEKSLAMMKSQQNKTV